jgi:dTMP kinase
LSLFITLEGPDGSGKSTQASRLAERLRRLGREVLLTREPGGTLIGDQIRRVLMSLENTSMNPRTEILLFSASRAQIVHEVIRPHLDAGYIVVCDRFYDSTLAYQGYGHRLDLDALKAITAFATGGLVPDLTVLLDVPVEHGLARRHKGGDWNRLDAYDLAFHTRVREGYFELVKADPGRWLLIDADREAGLVEEDVWRAVAPRLPAVAPAD